MKQSRSFFAFILIAICMSCYSKTYMNNAAIESNSFSIVFQDSLEWADYYYNIHRYQKAISIYEKNLKSPNVEQTHILKRLALSEAALEHPAKSTSNINEYLQLDFNPIFLLNEGFDPIRESTEFKSISEKVIPSITIWSFIYLFVALIGFYVVFLICLNKKIHPTSRFSLSNSFFYFHPFVFHFAYKY